MVFLMQNNQQDHQTLVNNILTRMRSPGFQSAPFWSQVRSDKGLQTVRFIVHWEHGMCGVMVVKHVKTQHFEGAFKLSVEETADRNIAGIIHHFQTGLELEFPQNCARVVLDAWKTYYRDKFLTKEVEND